MAKPKKRSEGHELCTQADLAECFGLSQESISSLTKQGTLVRDGESLYPLRENAKRMIASLRERRSAGNVKERIAALQEQKLQLEIDAIKKVVLPERELRAAWSDHLLTARQKILSLGARISPRVVYCKSESEAQALVDQECHAVLTELSRFSGTEIAEGELPLESGR